MFTFFDLAFLVALFVIQPIYGRYAWVQLQRAVAAGHVPDRVHLYRQTIAVQWGALLVLAVGWWWLDRPAADLGLHGTLGLGFAIAALLVAAVLGVLAALAWRSRSASPEDKLSARGQLGDLLPMLPQADRDMPTFHFLSFTAGVVEEILYRGFVLWVLSQWMPLWAAALTSSVAFGLAHGYQGASGVLRTGSLGLLLAGLYVGSGSIWLPILFHALFDVVQGVQIRELFRDRDAQPLAAA